MQGGGTKYCFSSKISRVSLLHQALRFWAAALNMAHPGSPISDFSLEQSENKPPGSWSLGVWGCALGVAENSKESSLEWRMPLQAPCRKWCPSQGCWEEPEREMGERGWTMFRGARLGEVRRG